MFEHILQDTLRSFDEKIEQLDELDFQNTISGLKPENIDWNPPLAWKAEVIAFDFCENYRWDGFASGRWGTYFGPTLGVSDKDGNFVGAPDISQLNPEMIEYWENRARKTQHPILRARYAGLVWDFSQKVTQNNPSIEMAHARIDAIIDIASDNLHKFETHTIDLLEHALALACQINDTSRIARVRDAVIAYENNTTIDEGIRIWVFSYDLLMKHKKVPLTEEIQNNIIVKLEDRLEQIINAESHDPWSAEAAALRLADYYRSMDDKSAIKRVLLSYGGIFETMAQKAAPMLAQAWLEGVCTKYRDFGLNDEADRILQKIHELGPDVRDSLKPISVETEITQEDIDQYVDTMVEGNLMNALQRIAFYHLPHKDEVINQIDLLKDKSLIMSLFTTKIQDYDGHSIASIGPVEDDLEGHIVRHMTQNIQFYTIFLRQAMSELCKRHELTSDKLSDYLLDTPLFDTECELLLREGLSAYFDEKPMSCIHILIPQVEAAIRKLVQTLGQTVLRFNRLGGQDLRTLDNLLRDAAIMDQFGEDIPLYLRVLFTDRRGINLRNNVCHGICPVGLFNMPMADRVVHSLLLLSMVRHSKEVE